MKTFIKPIFKASPEACFICENKNSLDNVTEIHHIYSSDHFIDLFQAVMSIRHTENVGNYLFVKYEKRNEIDNIYVAIEILM